MNSLATSADLATLRQGIQAVYTYLAEEVETRLVNVGNSVPAVERQALPWLRTDADGRFDAVFTWHDDSWYTPMPHLVGAVSLFLATTDSGAGWEDLTTGDVGLTPSADYVWRKFSGTGLLVQGSIAYRRYDQDVG